MKRAIDILGGFDKVQNILIESIIKKCEFMIEDLSNHERSIYQKVLRDKKITFDQFEKLSITLNITPESLFNIENLSQEDRNWCLEELKNDKSSDLEIKIFLIYKALEEMDE